MTVSAIFQAAEVKSMKGMRYEAEYILECLMFYIKSPSVYVHLRSVQMIPLPDPGHLRRLLRGMAIKFGFNDFALKMIHIFFKNCSFNETLG